MSIALHQRPGRLLFITLLTALLAACGGSVIERPSPSAQPTLPAAGAARAEALLAQANRESGAQAAKLRLEAASVYLGSGQALAAQRALSPIRPNILDPEDRARLGELRSRISLEDGNPVAALNTVPGTNPSFPAELNAQIELTYARTVLSLSDTADGVQALVKREQFLRRSDRRSLQDNRDLIWAALTSPEYQANLLARPDNIDATTEGWLELALIARSAWIDQPALDAAWTRWRQRFPNHPAAPEYVRRAEQISGRGTRLPERIALLLPMTGPLATPADAIATGFTAAWFQAGGPGEVRVYDTQALGLEGAVSAALSNGALVLVGPLSKGNVARMARLNTGAVPVLALNQSPSALGTNLPLFQFSLAPEDEARAAAERAVNNRQLTTVAMAPESDWGRRVLSAYTEHMQSLGGRVVSSRYYEPDQSDFGAAIRGMLDLESSKARAQAVARAVGYKPKFQERRRADVDAIFMAANPRTARLLKPQLKFHYAGDLPVYATSRVFDGQPDPQADRDVDGVRFSDMPWMLSEDPEIARLRASIERSNPAGFARFPRLYAFGIDAFRLLPLVGTGAFVGGSAQFVPATTGNLFVRPDRSIGRGLMWAEFRRGRPITLEPRALAGETTTPAAGPQG